MKNGMKETDGCDEERWRGRLAEAAQVGSDEGSFSLKECRDASFAGVSRGHVGWSCPHLQHLNRYHQSGRWARTKGKETTMG